MVKKSGRQVKKVLWGQAKSFCDIKKKVFGVNSFDGVKNSFLGVKKMFLLGSKESFEG